MASRFQASSRIETDFPFECRCGFVGRGEVVGEGWSETDSGPALFTDAHAESRALDDAEGKAWADAISSVELAPCPACGKRDSDKWRAWLGGRLLPGLTWGVLGGAVALLGLFLLRQRFDAWPLVAAAVALPLVSGAVLSTQIARKRARSEAVRVLPVGDATADRR